MLDLHSKTLVCLFAGSTHSHPYASPPFRSPAPEPMQVDTIHLSNTECQRQIHIHHCLYCGEEGHYLPLYPVRPPRPVVSTIQLPPMIASLTRTDVIITSHLSSVSAQALIDSGSSGNFISQLLRILCIKKSCMQALNINNILGKPLGYGYINHKNPTVTLHIRHLHEKIISFLVLDGSTAHVILGFPWMLKTHLGYVGPTDKS